MDMDVDNLSTSVLQSTRTWPLRNLEFDSLVPAQLGCRAARPAANPLGSPIVVSVIAVAHLLMASCAMLTEEERAAQEYEQSNRLILARESYERRTIDCQRIGGSMQIVKYNSSRFGKYTAQEYKMAQCVRY